jgi:hypothetical protein
MFEVANLNIMKQFLLVISILAFSIPSLAQENFEEIDLIEYEGNYSQIVNNIVPESAAPMIEHGYGLRKSRRLKYTGWGIAVVGSAVFSISPNSDVGLISGVAGILGGVLFQVCMVVQDIQTGVFLRDVEGETPKRSKNNGFNGVIFFDDNKHSYFKVVKFLEGNSSDPSVIIEYERFGLIKTETIKVNSPKLFWE